MKLRNQIIFLGAVSVSTLFLVIALILYVEFPEQQDKLLVHAGCALVENLRLRIEPLILTDDRLSLSDALSATKQSDENIVYIFVLDKNTRPIASTYERGVPSSLINLVCQGSGGSGIRFFCDDVGSCLNISAPLMQGDLGSVHFGINRGSVKAFVNKSILQLSMVFAIISVLSMALAVLIGRGVSKPLEQIAAALKKGKNRWPRLDQIYAGHTSEVREFVEIFKLMIKELEDYEEKRRDYEQKLLSTERLASIGELASEVAHEINNPLDGLIEIAKCLETAPDDHDKISKYVPLLKQGLERIAKTGRNLLSFSRSDGSNYKEVFDLCKVVNNTVALLEGSMAKEGVTVTVLCKERHRVIGNAVAVGQAVMNLLLNAADALSPHGGKIGLEISSGDSQVAITVTDNGPGISEQISDKIFEAFFSTKTSKGGSGLGLAVSRSLIRKCDGELLLAERKVPGGGARFVITLVDADKKGRYDVTQS